MNTERIVFMIKLGFMIMTALLLFHKTTEQAHAAEPDYTTIIEDVRMDFSARTHPAEQENVYFDFMSQEFRLLSENQLPLRVELNEVTQEAIEGNYAANLVIVGLVGFIAGAVVMIIFAIGWSAFK